jgi:drug/metabolite transporter (DMT)-like permease
MTAFLVILVVIPGCVSDILNAAGMKRHGEITDWTLSGLIRTVGSLCRNVFIVSSIPAMAVSFFALMALISTTNLSFAVPVTASSYIVDAVFAKFLLHENVEWHRWAGISLVAIGIGLLAR